MFVLDPKIITFYSYKGGVGRSMALANVAWLLAKKYQQKVLVVDWDLEAPGIHKYFDMKDDTQAGLIDILYKFLDLAKTEECTFEGQFLDISKYIFDIKENFGKGSLSILPAGKINRKYGNQIAQFDWIDFYKRFHGFGFIEYLKEELKQKADFVLVDSRTGLSDIGGICTLQLPDVVVLMFALNEQSIFGTEMVIESILTKSKEVKRNKNPPQLIIIPSRVEKFLEIESKNTWEITAAQRLNKYISNNFLLNGNDFRSLSDFTVYMREKSIPYVGYYSFGEKLSVKEDISEEPNKSFNRVTEMILETCLNKSNVKLDQEQNHNQILNENINVLYGKMWYFFGIGGAGCNLVDSILARKHYLNEVDKNGYLSRVWEMAIQDFKLFDTNTTGIIGSFIAKTEGWSEGRILSQCQLGLHDGTIGGGSDRLEGERAMEQTIKSGSMDKFKLTRNDIKSINESQAAMIIHSTARGTGCGASPIFARYLKEKILKNSKNKMIISFTVLPDEEDIDSGIVGGNAFIGLGKIVRSVDAVFLCDNEALLKIPFKSSEYEYLKEVVPFMWKRNQHIVEFIEALSLQSLLVNDEDPAGFDLMDAIHPARMSQERQNHAPILVPVLGEIDDSDKISAQTITNLFINTLLKGKLAECDYKKAKGASFVIYGPRKAMEQLEDLRSNGISVMQIARGFLDTENKQKNISIFYTTRKHLTKLHMLGLLWNPPLKVVDMMEQRVDGCILSTPALRDDPSVKEAVKLAREVHKDLGSFFVED